MKKLLTITLAIIMALSVAGCSGSGQAKADGTYTAEMSAPSNGWTDTLTVEYKDGKIVSASFESYDADGNKKSEASAETYPMDPSPSVWIPEMDANILKAGTAKKIDTIAGATYASNNARALLEAIEKDGVAGETITVDAPAE